MEFFTFSVDFLLFFLKFRLL